MATIDHLRALEILDSRGRPTLKVWCRLSGGAEAAASVPSGASTGRAEALELRDGDPQRYGGLGCRKAVKNVNKIIASAMAGRRFASQEALDRCLVDLDGTPAKSALGANALLGVSLAYARAEALERGVPLFAHFADLAGKTVRTLPRVTINLFSGGKHAGGQVAIQDVLMVPVSARTVADSLAMAYAVYQSASRLTGSRYGVRPLKADEGGLAPPFPDTEAMLADAVESIEAAGLKPGTDMALAVDVASSHFYGNGLYEIDGERRSSEAMITLLEGWAERYPIVSIEDGLAENDWEHWPQLCRRLRSRCLVLGDDFLCTNPVRIQRAVAGECATALLLKVNQIGTLTEAAHAAHLAREAGWQMTVSARSGETEDDWLADLAVGWGGHQIKIGSITQSERLAKYNRLLEIEAQSPLPLVYWP